MKRGARLVRMIGAVALGAVACTTIAAGDSSDSCAACLLARFWSVPSDAWTAPGPPDFPELPRLASLRPTDLGVAFSGGGTRSTTATLGELSGLSHNGWLSRVRYIAAISGGAWAAVPFTYSKDPLAQFLGADQCPADLKYQAVVSTPNGLLASAIARSSLAPGGLQEAGGALLGLAIPDRTITNAVNQALSLVGKGRREANRKNKTYARLIGETFIDPLVEEGGPSASDRLFSWDNDAVASMTARNPGQLPADIVVTARDRPFLIVGATMVSTRRDYAYPLLMPIEYTPLYVGIRQAFGERFGGSYVWPWAYDTQAVAAGSDDVVRVKYNPNRLFSLADVAASTSAAPQLLLLLGSGLPAQLNSALQTAAGYFPSFTHFAVHRDAPPLLAPQMPHGDGGFVDNLGLMPLLARQVHNVMVFVNTNTRYFEQNDDLKSYFMSIGPPDTSGDKTHNRAFEPAHYAEVMAGFWKQLDKKQALVYCGKNWTVLGNERYNIRPYDGFNICWFYNAAVPAWQDALRDPGVRRIVAGQDGPNSQGFSDFPWFSTFEEDKPHLIELTTPQVNLLANLTSWTLTNADSIRIVRDALGDIVPEPTACPVSPQE
jgi:hypothetical protein